MSPGTRSNGHISITAGTLDGFHGDLADRIIVSTAESRTRLVTADEAILDWESTLPRVDARQ
jgi:PIN domain nuclease of toxin-antitoxin system